jgi:hypothetical protein
MTLLVDFIDNLNQRLPDVCTDKDLIQTIPSVFKSASTLNRMREKNIAPPHFFIKPNYYYLKGEVVSWIKSKHVDFKKCSIGEAVDNGN